MTDEPKFTIGAATYTEPPSSAAHAEKHQEIWLAANALGRDQYLPIECNSEKDARRLSAGLAGLARKRGFRIAKRGTCIWLAKDPTREPRTAIAALPSPTGTATPKCGSCGQHPASNAHKQQCIKRAMTPELVRRIDGRR